MKTKKNTNNVKQYYTMHSLKQIDVIHHNTIYSNTQWTKPTQIDIQTNKTELAGMGTSHDNNILLYSESLWSKGMVEFVSPDSHTPPREKLWTGGQWLPKYLWPQEWKGKLEQGGNILQP